MPKNSWTQPGGSSARFFPGELDHVLVSASVIMCLLEMARSDNAKSQIAEVLGDLQGAIARHECLVEVVQRCQDGCHESTDLATSTIVF